jgi:hypothetical protein
MQKKKVAVLQNRLKMKGKKKMICRGPHGP